MHLVLFPYVGAGRGGDDGGDGGGVAAASLSSHFPENPEVFPGQPRVISPRSVLGLPPGLLLD